MDSRSSTPESRSNSSEESFLWLASPAVSVAVGQDPRRVFQVHGAILCTSSKFFRNVLKPEWTSNREERKPIELTDPEDDPETFTIYVHWLYYKMLPASVNSKPSSSQMGRLIDAYLLGEKLMDNAFKNSIIAAIIASFCHSPRSERRFPSSLDIDILYERTTPSSRLRNLIVDLWVYVAHASPGWMRDVDNVPREFLVDVTKAMIKNRPIPSDQRPWELATHEYFEKDDKELEEEKV
ncbi:hypothetical protein B0J11DRAFT_3323 [Dendryphion nanum]|uniref:BTB domain-containing protein n=1 Tax=Dendryphion nanum TaxID=256645 RepID=A0A9P9EHQ0_9PLEO|nr:hypothetical protein B0J11DRAFT_3323 [Dendryphion nanum]